jgi:hypothetical protein
MEDESSSSSSSSSDDDDGSSERNRRKRAVYRAFLVYAMSLVRKNKTRSGRKRRFRRHPERLLQEAIDDGLFSREYRMSKMAFCKLCALLDSQLAPSSKNRRADIITVKEKVMIALRYFASSTLRNELRDFMEREGLSRPGSI